MIRIGVISDIHCHELRKGELQGGYYFPSMPESPVSQNPFASLKKMIRENAISMDFVLSPGDYAHRIDKIGLKSSWDQLKMISSELGAKYLIGTIGNHDVSSRDSGDSFADIKTFDIDFPVYKINSSPDLRSNLLNQKYFLIDDEEMDCLFLVLNSCFDHWSSVEASKGKVDIELSRSIQEEILKSSRKRKILLVHHHPVIHETGILDTGDLIEGSEELIKNISGVDLIIHGHKHDFRFTQLSIYPKNQNVLGSGSFSCYKTSLRGNSYNAFHEIEFHSETMDNCTNQGIVKTYTYNPYDGWKLEHGMEEGFGCNFTIAKIEELILKELVSASMPYISWENLVEKVPILRYITRNSRIEALGNLKEKGEIMDLDIDSYTMKIGYIIIK